MLNESQPKAILLDLDDTIIAWDAVAEQSWNNVCLSVASETAGLEGKKLFNAVRETIDWYWGDPVRHQKGRLNLKDARREVVEIALKSLGVNIPFLANKIADSYSVEREKAAFLVPDAVNTLKYFKNCGIKLALASNGSPEFQRAKIERFGLTPFFDCILIEGEFGIGKPEKRFFKQILEQINVDAAEAWMIGDDLQRDIIGAKKAGIFSIWVDWKGTGIPEPCPVKPDGIVNSLSELLGVFDDRMTKEDTVGRWVV